MFPLNLWLFSLDNKYIYINHQKKKKEKKKKKKKEEEEKKESKYITFFVKILLNVSAEV